MSAGRKAKDLIGRRRRAGGDSDEEEDVASNGGDSHSEGSVVSDNHEQDAASEHGAGEQEIAAAAVIAGGQETENQAFTTGADTQLMLNGSSATQASSEKPVDFAEMSSKAQGQSGPVEGRKRAPEQVQQRRGADPTFIPSRGNFFMHDARGTDQRGHTGFGRGRGRGRSFVGGPFAPSGFGQAQAPRVADAPWAHDLHEAINEPEHKQRTQPAFAPRVAPVHTATAARTAHAPEYRPYSFSTSKALGKVQVRVSLPGMKAAVPFAGVLITQYTRLPDHRPPLRRDKPVRISLPDRPPAYILPSAERSFIFIPRAMRPNQQAMGRNRLGPSSRRTSMHGGSVYSPSVAASRRSSMARELGREMMYSPANSVAARQTGPSRPVVRLPQGISQPPSVASPAGSVAANGPGGFPLPQTPQFEHYNETATMHQPRPQKTIQVSGIETPAALSMHAPKQQDQQPFENQLPHHMAESSYSSSINQDTVAQGYYAYQGQSGTPLSHIPERAIHAQPFQPPTAGYNQAYYGQYSQPGYYYQTMPMYMPQTTPRTAAAQPAIMDEATQAMMAHETNGMVYYIDPSAAMQQSYGQQGAYGGAEGYAAYQGGGQDSGWYYPGNVAGEAMYYPQQ